MTGGLSGNLTAGGVVVDTAIGAIGGAVAGQIVPAAFKSFVPTSVKGDIGEGLTAASIYLGSGSIADRQVSNNVGKSPFDFLLSSGTYVEAKFGTAQLSARQREAARQFEQKGIGLEVQYWDYPTFSGMLGAGSSVSSTGKSK